MSRSAAVAQLRLAMAFGQGAGCMLASPDAIEALLSLYGSWMDQPDDWADNELTHIEMARLLGQVASTVAGAQGRWEIERADIDRARQSMVGPCPCTRHPLV